MDEIDEGPHYAPPPRALAHIKGIPVYHIDIELSQKDDINGLVNENRRKDFDFNTTHQHVVRYYNED